MSRPKTANDLEWVRPAAVQARSQQTVTRLLDAAEALIDEGGLESATVAEIARRADSSVGSFYARFGDKDGLVRSVFERFHEQAIATAKLALTPERWTGIHTEQALESMVLFLARILRERRRLIVGLLIRASSDPHISALGEGLHQHIAEHMHALIELRGERIAHPDPDRAVGMMVWMVLSSLEVRALYSSGGVMEGEPDEVVAAEIARMCVRYLGVETQGRTKQNRPKSNSNRKGAAQTERTTEVS